MNPTEPKNAFLLLRANGWSLRSISKELGIPKSTLFDWESDPPTRRAINVFKALQLEKLQERYIPSFEEELQKLSTCLDRVERALEKQDYDAMRPEFLLRTSLQLRARLNTLRSDIQPIRTLHQGELPPVPLPGCISRSRTILESDDDAGPSPQGRGKGEGEGAVQAADASETTPQDQPANETNPDNRENVSEPEPSATATCNGENRTPVRLDSPLPPNEPSRENLQPVLPPPDRYGDLATPLSNIPMPTTADETVLTAGFNRSRTPSPGTGATKLSRRFSNPQLHAPMNALFGCLRKRHSLAGT